MENKYLTNKLNFTKPMIDSNSAIPVNYYEAAKSYLDLNLSVLPTNSDKKPIIKWESYQNRRMNNEEAERFFNLTKHRRNRHYWRTDIGESRSC